MAIFPALTKRVNMLGFLRLVSNFHSLHSEIVSIIIYNETIQKNLNYHARLHTRIYQKKTHWYKCPHKDCDASFEFEPSLKTHLRSHNNDLDSCQYCPFRYIVYLDYWKHMKQHFRIKDFKCDQCDFESTSKWDLNRHYRVHEGLTYTCLICNDYKSPIKQPLYDHLKRKHGDTVGKHITWDSVQKFVKINAI